MGCVYCGATESEKTITCGSYQICEECLLEDDVVKVLFDMYTKSGGKLDELVSNLYQMHDNNELQDMFHSVNFDVIFTNYFSTDKDAIETISQIYGRDLDYIYGIFGADD